MKTPERSVEEIVEEFKHLKVPENREDIKNWKKMDNWLTQTLQTERQRCDEMVERIIKELEERQFEAPYTEGINYAIGRIEALTQPNNPK